MSCTFCSSFHTSPLVLIYCKGAYLSVPLQAIKFCSYKLESNLNSPSSVETCWKLSKSLGSSQVPWKGSGNAWRLSIFEIPFNAQFSPKCWLHTEIKVVHLCWDKQPMETGIINCICSLLSQLRTVPLWLVHICSRTLSSSSIEMFILLTL